MKAAALQRRQEMKAAALQRMQRKQEKAAAAAPLTSEETRQQAQAEKLTLLVADTKAGYFGVCLNNPGLNPG